MSPVRLTASPKVADCNSLQMELSKAIYITYFETYENSRKFWYRLLIIAESDDEINYNHSSF